MLFAIPGEGFQGATGYMYRVSSISRRGTKRAVCMWGRGLDKEN